MLHIRVCFVTNIFQLAGVYSVNHGDEFIIIDPHNHTSQLAHKNIAFQN